MQLKSINKKQNAGFTLIELLIVILVISTLSGVTLGVINSAGIRQKARDSQRSSDLARIRTALELYFTDHRGYPKLITWTDVTNASLSGVLTPGYMNNMAIDPNGTTGSNPCASAGTYYYSYISDNPGASVTYASKYILTARMEVASSDDDSMCSSLNNWTGSMSCAVPSGVYCYGLESQ